MTAAIHSRELEHSLLAAALLSPVVAPILVGQCEIRPDDFYSDKCRHVMAAIVTLVDHEHPVDTRTVLEQLRRDGTLDEVGGKEWVETTICAAPANVGAIRKYADDLKQQAMWRNRQHAAYQALEACSRMDASAWIAAEAQMTQDLDATTRGCHMSSEQAAHRFLDAVEAKPEPRIQTPWPWMTKRMHGGFRRGQLTTIIGPGHQGKSVLADQIAQAAAEAGFRTGLYINEMSADERVERFAARMSNVALDWISAATAGTNPLSGSQAKAVTSAMSRLAALPLEFIDAPGWTARQIVRHAAGLKLDLLVFDILQRLPYQHQSRRRDMDEAMGDFDQFAKRAGCHVLCVSHINRERTRSTGEIPAPLMSDVMESKLIVDIPDNVIAFWRKQDASSLDPTDEGAIKLLKGRGAKFGGIEIDFDGPHQRVTEARRNHMEVAA